MYMHAHVDVDNTDIYKYIITTSYYVHSWYAILMDVIFFDNTFHCGKAYMLMTAAVSGHTGHTGQWLPR